MRHINLEVFLFKEGKQFVAYAPAIDLSTTGKTFIQAKRYFAEAVRIFFEECHKMHTPDEILKRTVIRE